MKTRVCPKYFVHNCRKPSEVLHERAGFFRKKMFTPKIMKMGEI